MRLVSVVKAGSWAVGEREQGLWVPASSAGMHVCVGEQGGGHGKIRLVSLDAKLREAGAGPHSMSLPWPFMPKGDFRRLAPG